MIVYYKNAIPFYSWKLLFVWLCQTVESNFLTEVQTILEADDQHKALQEKATEPEGIQLISYSVQNNKICKSTLNRNASNKSEERASFVELINVRLFK